MSGKPKMNRRAKRLWLAALFSGQLKQARRTLRRRNGAMCCLGVLCEVAIADGVKVERVWVSDGGRPHYEYDGWETMPPPAVLEWAGIDSKATIPGEGYQPILINYLTERNDQGMSFTWIGNFIRRNTTS